MHRAILHLDMDAYFASVEQLDDPSLRGRPVIVGREARGVVSAASYEARAYGVRSAMPVAQARRLCPAGVFLPGRFSRYRELSHQIVAIIRRFSPLVERASIDEAYADITGTETLFGPPRVLARTMKDAVRAETGLPCSVGVAPIKFLAKIASDFQKPDGLTVIDPEAMPDFLARLPLAKIPGVGKRALEALTRLGATTAGDLARRPDDFWERQLGKWGRELAAMARGLDDSQVVPHRRAKSHGAENTFDRDTDHRPTLERWLWIQAERVGRELRSEKNLARTVTLKVKFADFKQITRNKTLDIPTDADLTLFETAKNLLDALSLPRKVRLIGLSAGNFTNEARQPPLLPTAEDARREHAARIDQAVDAIRDKFGKGAIKRGRVFDFKP